MRDEMVIDGTNAILGRLASYAAKKSLLGKPIVIVNCDNVLVTGRPRTTIKEYNITRRRGGSSLNGPFFPKHPERIVKRTIRGMLSHRQKRGEEALSRIMCHNKLPQEYKDVKKTTFELTTKAKTIKLVELSREI